MELIVCTSESLCVIAGTSLLRKHLHVIFKIHLLSHNSPDGAFRSPHSPRSPPPHGLRVAARPGQLRSRAPLFGCTVRLYSAHRAGETHSRALLWSGNTAWVSARSPSQQVNRRKQVKVSQENKRVLGPRAVESRRLLIQHTAARSSNQNIIII